MILAVALALPALAPCAPMDSAAATTAPDLSIGAGDTLLSVVEGWAALEGLESRTTPSSARALEAEGTELLGDVELERGEAERFVEALLGAHGFALSRPETASNAFGVIASCDRAESADYRDVDAAELVELADRPALLVRFRIPDMQSEVPDWMVRTLTSTIFGKQEVDAILRDETDLLLQGGASRVASWARDLRAIAPREIPGDSGRAAPTETVSANPDESLLDLSKACFGALGVRACVTEGARDRMAALPCGLLAPAEIAPANLRTFIESLIVAHGLFLSEIPAGADDLALVRCEEDLGRSLARSYPVDLELARRRGYGPATHVGVRLALQSTDVRQLPTTLRSYFFPVPTSAPAALGSTYAFEAPASLAEPLSSFLSAIDASEGGEALDLSVYARDPERLLPRAATDLSLPGSATADDLAVAWARAIDAPVIATPDVRQQLRSASLSGNGVPVPAADALGELDRRLAALRLQLCRSASERPILTLATQDQATPLPVDLKTLMALPPRESFLATTVMHFDGIDVRQLPTATFPFIASLGLRAATLVSVGNSQSAILRGPVDDLQTFVREAKRQNEAGEVDRDAWRALAQMHAADR